MLKFITNLFNKKPVAPTAPTPYKIETPVAESKPVKVAKPKAEKKPAVKKTTTRKPKA
jgi:hypothetical protein